MRARVCPCRSARKPGVVVNVNVLSPAWDRYRRTTDALAQVDDLAIRARDEGRADVAKWLSDYRWTPDVAATRRELLCDYIDLCKEGV